ncbi:MAG: cation transporter [Actinomycetota bacterium]|nr:cation transporter [Actinomycetota bacterium]
MAQQSPPLRRLPGWATPLRDGFPGTRQAALDRARLLNRLTVAWNVTEGAVALVAGVAAGSVSLVGFGLDSVIEVSASVVLAWRLHQERGGGCMADSDRRATQAIAVGFAVLAVYVWVDAGTDLWHQARPEASGVGMALAALSLAVMPWLARAKRRLGPALGSRAATSEADQTRLCAMLSAVVLVGLGLNAALGWWWADPVAALAVGVIAAGEAVRTWRAESLEDTCCS